MRDAGAQAVAGSPGPRAKSFVDLPPEVRNRVYDSLFRFTEYAIIKPKSYLYCNEEEVRKGSGKPTSCAGINLLGTCRAIHQEAASVLYSGNTYYVLVPLSETMLVERWSTNAAETWFSDIGQHYSLLRNVNIDIASVFFGSEMNRDQKFLDILPLLRSGLPSRVPQLQLSLAVVPDLSSTLLPKVNSKLHTDIANCMNDSWKAIKDPSRISVDLGLHLRCLPSLSGIWISRSGNITVMRRSRIEPANHTCKRSTWLDVHYRRSSSDTFDHRINDTSPLASLRDALGHCCIGAQILSHVIASEPEFVLHIDNELGVSALKSLCRTSNKICGAVYKRYKESGEAVSTTIQVTGRAQNFTALQHWVEKGVFYPPKVLVIHVQTPTQTNKASLSSCIDVMQLLKAIWRILSKAEEVATSSYINVTELLKSTWIIQHRLEVKIQHKQHQSRIFLREIYKQFLIFLGELNTANLWQPQSALPNMYMDDMKLLTHAESIRKDGMVTMFYSAMISQQDFRIDMGLRFSPDSWYRLTTSAVNNTLANFEENPEFHEDWEIVQKLGSRCEGFACKWDPIHA